MAELKRTTTLENKKNAKKSHYHMIYINDKEQAVSTGEVTKAKITAKEDHNHEIVWQESIPPVMDETNQQEIQPGVPGKYIVEPAKGHDHRIIPLIGEGKDSDELPDDRSDLIEMVQEYYKEARRYEKDFRKSGEESEKFYIGEQWDKDDKNKLEGQNRPVLTLNEIEGKIDVLTGFQRQNRFDISCLPIEEGDGRVADMLTGLIKNITEQNNFEYIESEVFEDGTIVGRGAFDLDIDYSENLEGEIKIDKTQWDECYFGPHNKKDMSDCEYGVRSDWVSYDYLVSLHPDRKKELQANLGLLNKADLYPEFEDEKDSIIDNPGDQYATGTEVNVLLGDSGNDVDLINKSAKKFRYMELEKLIYKKIVVLTNVDDDFFHNGEFMSAKEITVTMQISGFQKFDRRRPEVDVVEIAGSVFLDKRKAVVNDFSYKPFYAKKRRGKIWGKVEPAKDVQREINKRTSTMSDIMLKMDNYGYFYDSSTFQKSSDVTKFKKQASKPGFMQLIKDVARPPVRAEGVKFPVELVNMQELSSSKMKEIMNVNEELIGQSSRAESGVAIQAKQRQALVGNEFLYDNLALTRRLIGRWLLQAIQKVYSADRIIRILFNRQKQRDKNVKIGDRNLDQISKKEMQEIQNLLNTEDLSKYDIAVSESAYSPTKRQANFLQWSEMARNGVPVPPQVLVELSDLGDKDKVIASMEAQQKQAQELEQQKMQTEITKTAIARGGNNQGQ